MNSSTKASGLSIRCSHSLTNELLFMSGLTSLGMVPIGISGVIDGEEVFAGIFLACIPVTCGLFAILIRRSTPSTFATLTNERMSLTEFGNTETVIEWKDVNTIRWPKNGSKEIPVRIQIWDEDEGDHREEIVNLDRVMRADLAELIAYIHLACVDTKQENWPEFCVQHAEPLLENTKEEDSVGVSFDTENEGVFSTPTELAARFLVASFKYPFIGGLLAPLVFLALAVLLVSRELYWITSLAILVSSVVNIRLVWGEWVAPFTEYCMATVVAFFFAGGLASSSSARRTRSQLISTYSAAFWLFLAIVLGPLMVNAAALGWLPAQVAKYAMLGMFLALHIPVIVGIKKGKARKKSQAILGSESLQRWNNFEMGIRAHLE